MAADLVRPPRQEKGKRPYSAVAEEQPIALGEQNQTTRRAAGKDLKIFLARRTLTFG
jgi:hypothetical protein